MEGGGERGFEGGRGREEDWAISMLQRRLWVFFGGYMAFVDL